MFRVITKIVSTTGEKLYGLFRVPIIFPNIENLIKNIKFYSLILVVGRCQLRVYYVYMDFDESITSNDFPFNDFYIQKFSSNFA